MINMPSDTRAGRETETTTDVRERAIHRIALFLDRPEHVVEANLPEALEGVLTALPWESRLRRDRDRMVVEDVRFLFERDIERDDLRRPRLKYLLEHVERRTRM